jgi:hypothetical protein
VRELEHPWILESAWREVLEPNPVNSKEQLQCKDRRPKPIGLHLLRLNIQIYTDNSDNCCSILEKPEAKSFEIEIFSDSYSTRISPKSFQFNQKEDCIDFILHQGIKINSTHSEVASCCSKSFSYCAILWVKFFC